MKTYGDEAIHWKMGWLDAQITKCCKTRKIKIGLERHLIKTIAKWALFSAQLTVGKTFKVRTKGTNLSLERLAAHRAVQHAGQALYK